MPLAAVNVSGYVPPVAAAGVPEFAVLQRPYQGPPILEEDPR